MTGTMKRLIALFVALVLAVCVMVLPATATQAHAATKPAMEKVSVKWDLKKNKTVKFKSYVAGVGFKTFTVKITGYTVKKAGKKKKVSFTYHINENFKPTKSEVGKMYNSGLYQKWGSATGYAMMLADYNTGYAVNEFVDTNVTTVYGVPFRKGAVSYKDSKGHKVKLYKDYGMKSTFTFPADQDVCFGMMGMLKNPLNSKDQTGYKFSQGQIPFSKTTHYKTYKGQSHWMHLK